MTARRMRPFKIAVLAALCLFPALSQAGNLRVLGAGIELPFDYELVDTQDASSNGILFSATQRKRIDVRDADGSRNELELTASYIVSMHPSNAAMEDAIAKSEAEQAAKPGVRSSGSLEIDGFRFHFIDGPSGNRKYPFRMGVSGVVDGALYRFAILARDQRLLTEDLAERIKGIRIDHAALSKLRPAFEDEGKSAAKDGVLETPLGGIHVGTGIGAWLSNSTLVTDASGRPVFRIRGFSLYWAGWMSLRDRRLVLYVGCGREDARDDDGDFLAMNGDDGEDEGKGKGEDKGEDGGRYIDVSDPMPAVLAGLPALTTTARSEKPVDFHHVSNRRWQARKDGVLYQAGLKRLNGSSIGESIGSQLETAPAACRLDLDYGPRLD